MQGRTASRRDRGSARRGSSGRGAACGNGICSISGTISNSAGTCCFLPIPVRNYRAERSFSTASARKAAGGHSRTASQTRNPNSRLQHVPHEPHPAAMFFPPLRTGHDHGEILVLSCERARSTHRVGGAAREAESQEHEKKSVAKIYLFSLCLYDSTRYILVETGV